MRISATEIQDFLRCRVQWNYGSPNRLNYQPKEPATALWLGEGIHAALEQFYRDGTDPVDTFTQFVAKQRVEWRVEGIEVPSATSTKAYQLGVAMLQGYLAMYGASPDDDADDIDVLVSEQEFAVAIPNTNDGWLVGRMDGLMYDRHGKLWVLEHKTYTMQPEFMSAHILNLQISAYVWAAQQLVIAGVFAPHHVESNEQVVGALYNGLRKKEPGPNVSAPLFSRVWVPRNLHEIRQFGVFLKQVHDEMARPDLPILAAPGSHCGWCNFKDACLVRHVGGDEDWLLEASFKHGEKRGMVYTEVEG